MTRPKRHQSSADVDAEIRRLEAERRRLLDAEDQRRGALIREYLDTPNGHALREALGPFVSPRDVSLFGLSATSHDDPNVTGPRRARRPSPAESSGIVGASLGA